MSTFNLYKESKAIAQDALDEAHGDFDEAREIIHQICDGHEIAIYYGKAIDFCSNQNTGEGEAWLEDIGGIVQDGDTFGGIACRIAFATLLTASEAALADIEQESEG